MLLLGLDAGDFDGIVGHVEFAGDLHLLAYVLLGLFGVVEEVAFRLPLGSVAHDERIVPVLELDNGTSEAVRQLLRVHGGVLLVSLRVERRRAQTQGYGKCEGGKPRDQRVILKRQNSVPFPF